MPPIPIEINNETSADSKINPRASCDNLSVTSVTKRITKIFEDNPIDSGDSFETFSTNIYSSGIIPIFK